MVENSVCVSTLSHPPSYVVVWLVEEGVLSNMRILVKRVCANICVLFAGLCFGYCGLFLQCGVRTDSHSATTPLSGYTDYY